MSNVARYARALVFGKNDDIPELMHDLVRKELRKTDDWLYAPQVASTIKEAIEIVSQWYELDVIYFRNEGSVSLFGMPDGCIELAGLLKVHPNKPWVVFDPTMRYLARIFQDQGIRTWSGIIENGNIVNVIRTRWLERHAMA